MTKQTALYDAHVAAGGSMVDFAGWMMPVNYGSQIEEHHAVRQAAGLFDVSHMTIIDVQGAQSLGFLQRLVANDVGRLDEQAALYGALLNERGGIIDDLIVYRLSDRYRCVVNASTRDKVLAWFEANRVSGAEFTEQPESMIAVQGPQAIDHASAVLGQDLHELKPFSCAQVGEMLVGRTGYTGEDGVEVMLPHAGAVDLWQAFTARGVAPAGLGARDTLRLEAGLNLYGQDMDETTTPLECNIAWTVARSPEDRDFIGRQAIEPLRKTYDNKLTGLILRDKGILRHDQRVITPEGDGVVTSGSFSPTLQSSIALARIPRAAQGECEVEIRGKRKKAEIVKPPFVRHGKILVS